jgi:hypothetical protein
LTTAAMLMLLSPAPQEFFAFPDQVRRIYMDPLGDDPAFSSVFAWRDEMYKKHRGEAVRP